MAFIRWKKNKFGVRQAYLIHSYRDENGKPRHRTLAYLGNNPELKPEHLAVLKEKHKDLAINWEMIKQPAPLEKTDIISLSDEELMRRLRELRRERGLSIPRFVRALNVAGLNTLTLYGKAEPLTLSLYRRMEEGLAQPEWTH